MKLRSPQFQQQSRLIISCKFDHSLCHGISSSLDFVRNLSRVVVPSSLFLLRAGAVPSLLFGSGAVCSSTSFSVVVQGDRRNLHNIHERKAEMAVRGEKLAQQRLFEADADVEVKHWERRNSDIALSEINQEFESQRSQPQQANQWADQAQRQNIRLC